MYIITVVPISRGTAVMELSYFSAVEYPRGSFVNIDIRNSQRLALVLKSEKVSNVKSKVRSSSYPLKKITRQKSRQCITTEFVRAVENTAKYHATTPGAVLFSAVPKTLLEQKQLAGESLETKKPKLRGYIVPRLFQGLSNERTEFYKTSIRETFAAHGSVFIMVPTIADGERLYSQLKTGIEKYSYILHSNITKKKQLQTVKDILQNTHPVLIIGTYQYLALPRHDLATIIIEREDSPIYRQRNRPFIDARVLAYELAAQIGGQIYLADLPLRIESIYKKEQQEYEEIVTGHHRMHFPTKAEIINMQGIGTSQKKQFRVLDRTLLDKIRESGLHGGRTFLYVARRGLSPITLCRDCGTTVTCNECDVSVVLHKGSKENYFLCHSCGALRHARERCKNCRSWRLEAFGIGTELVEKEIQRILPKRKVFILSSDTIKSHSEAKKLITEFYSTPKSILVGTEMALPYLTKHVPLVGVASLDSLLSLASWNIYERIASTLTRLREIAGEELLVQTRRPEAKILHTVLSGNFSGFYRSELKIRKQLGYPPYTVIVKISITGSQEDIEKKMEEATAHVHPFELVTFSRSLRAPQGKHTLHGFLRIRKEEWPHEELLKKLQTLPPSYTISVDPDSIL